MALCLPPDEYLCQQLNKAMDGAGTDENTLIEIICSKTNNEIKSLVETYEKCIPLKNSIRKVFHDSHFSIRQTTSRTNV